MRLTNNEVLVASEILSFLLQNIPNGIYVRKCPKNRQCGVGFFMIIPSRVPTGTECLFSVHHLPFVNHLTSFENKSYPYHMSRFLVCNFCTASPYRKVMLSP